MWRARRGRQHPSANTALEHVSDTSPSRRDKRFQDRASLWTVRPARMVNEVRSKKSRSVGVNRSHVAELKTQEISMLQAMLPTG